MKRISLVFVLLLLPLTANAEQKKIKIAGEKKVQPYGYAELSAEGFEKTVVWRVTPKPVQMSTGGDGVLRFGGIPGTTYDVEAIVVDFDKRTIGQEVFSVEFVKGEPGPGPGPTPPPDPPPGPPPTPVDPFVSALKQGLLQDGAEAALLPNLANFYLEAKGVVDSYETFGALFAKMQELSVKNQISGKIQDTQKVIQAFLKQQLPWKGATTERIADKKVVKDIFQYIADSLNKVR